MSKHGNYSGFNKHPPDARLAHAVDRDNYEYVRQIEHCEDCTVGLLDFELDGNGGIRSYCLNCRKRKPVPRIYNAPEPSNVRDGFNMRGKRGPYKKREAA